MTSSISISIKSTPSGLTSNSVPFHTVGTNTIKINDIFIDITDQIHKGLSSTSYNGKIMKKDSDFLES